MTTRRPHVLTPTKGNDRPSNVIFFDTETESIPGPNNSQVHLLRLGCATHCRTRKGAFLSPQKSITFYGSGTFWQFVSERARAKTTTYLTAHNIVYDLTILNGWMELMDLGWMLDSFYTKGSTSIFRWSKNGRKLIAVDNCNLFPGPLADWGERLGLPKLKIDFEACTTEELAAYCARDVEIMVHLWRMWGDFLDTHNCGSFKTTIGATAFSAYRRRFMPAKIFVHDDPLALRLERESYKGGRVEALFRGRSEAGPFYYLDVNSMYGFVLRRYEYPAGIWGSSEKADVSLLVRKLEKYSVIADVTIRAGDNLFPYKMDHHTCYPLGYFRTVLTTPELFEVVRNGWLVDCHALAWYRKSLLFSEYVKYFSALRSDYRQREDRGMSEICKLFVNSLYGKFGQTGFDQKIIGKVRPDEIWSMTVLSADTGQFYRHIAVAGQLYQETRAGESFHSCPAIAAHVTAYARLHLARLVRMVEPGHVFYMDTDSLIVDQRGIENLARLLDLHQVGMLKVEHDSPWIEINAPKDYKMDGRVRVKGIRPGSREIEPGTFDTVQWSRLDGMIEAGDLGSYKVRPIVKHQARVIHSGVVSPEGWVEPFYFPPPDQPGPEVLLPQPVQPELLPQSFEREP